MTKQGHLSLHEKDKMGTSTIGRFDVEIKETS